MERWVLGPISLFPADDNIANTKGGGVLRTKVLDYSFEAVPLGIAFAAIATAQEKLLSELLRLRLDLVVEYPFHVFQYKPSGGRSSGRIFFDVLTCGMRGLIISGLVVIESSSDLHEQLSCEIWAVFLG